MKSILLVGKYVLLTDILKQYIENNLCGWIVHTETYYQNISKTKAAQYDVVLIDLSNLKCLNINTLSAYLNLNNLILLTERISKDGIKLLKKVGARAILSKSTSIKKLISVIQKMNAPINSAMVLSDKIVAENGALHIIRISKREHEVAFKLLEGHSNREIASVLKITETTVKLHLKNLSDKLQAENRTQAALKFRALTCPPY